MTTPQTTGEHLAAALKHTKAAMAKLNLAPSTIVTREALRHLGEIHHLILTCPVPAGQTLADIQPQRPTPVERWVGRDTTNEASKT